MTPILSRSFRCLLCTALVLAVSFGPAGPAAAQDEPTRLLRFPDIHGEAVVFTYAGDLWLAPAAGGTARRLTAHPGVELFPRFSADGEWIAFTGQYDGDEQVYVVPTAGGVPRQLTFYPATGPLPPRWGYDHQVVGWTPDGKVLFRSHRDSWDISDSRLYTVAKEGGLPTALPMPTAGAGALSPDGTKIAYSPLSRDFRSWKRYQGGWAQDLYLFDLEAKTSRQLTDDPRSDRDPMWIGDSVYFASDRSGTLNLYRMPATGGEAAAVTSSTRWDVRWPAADERNGRIVYELGGELQVLDTATGASRAISIFVPDDGLHKRPVRAPAADGIENMGLSPKGERALFAARGDIFTAPIENGPTYNLTRSPGAHDRAPSWSPDGSRIAYISDAGGEEEIWLIDRLGRGEPRRLTSGGEVQRYDTGWSPDGERIAFTDKNGALHVVDVKSGKVTEIDRDRSGYPRGYAWSPDGAYLAYTVATEAELQAIKIWSAADGKIHPVTDPQFNSRSPAWDPAGKYLFYLGDHAFAPQIGDYEWNYVVNRQTQVYAVALRKDVPHPFPPRSDEVTVEGEGEDEDKEEDKPAKSEEKKGTEGSPKGKKDKKAADSEDRPKPIRIDFEGLGQRVAVVPVEAKNYAGLAAVDGHLLWAVVPAFYYGRSGEGPAQLEIFSMEEREAKTLAESLNGYQVSGDGSKILVADGPSYALYDAKPGAEAKKVSTSGLMVDRVPTEEWEQIFDEVWRRYRDFFYVANMHGYDWEAIGEQYRELLKHVAHRSDLNYVLSEMIAELNVSHAYVTGGDYEVPDRPQVALPGARFRLDESAGRYVIDRIFEGDNLEGRYRSPLTALGVEANEGDYVLAVDGVELTAEDNPYRLLRHRADRPVELTLNDKPTMEGARRVTFEPVTSEQALVYYDWVAENRRRVEEATDGRVGYLHIPDMGANGIREFIKWYYGQIRKEGLVVDVRGNGGGNVSPMLIERLSRRLLGVDFARNSDDPTTYPRTTFYGHMACLINETSASDGDIFPYMFREAGLGPLIGKRTWGGVVGIGGGVPLIDGGGVSVPESASASVDGRWIIEGYGVAPDIEVANRPEDLLAGRDPQLERGIQEVMDAIRADPKKLPTKPADPVRTQERYDGVVN